MSPLLKVISPSRFMASSLAAIAKICLWVVNARPVASVIHSLQDSAIVISYSTLDFTSISISPPSFGNSYFLVVTNNDLLPFCVMLNVLLSAPALMVTATVRSSDSVFSVVLNFTVAVPLPPLVGEAVHHSVPLRVSAMDKVQSEVVEKVMDFSEAEVSKDKPLDWIVGSIVMVGVLFTSGF